MVIPMIIDIINIDKNTSYSLAGFSILLPFVVSRLVVRKYSKALFLEYLEKVCLVVSITSLIGMCFLIYYPKIVLGFPTITFYGRRVYTVGVWGAIENALGDDLLRRNCGIGFEPGAFQFVANTGMALLLKRCFPIPTKNRLRGSIKAILQLLVYITTVLSTRSTTGIFIMTLLLGMSIIENATSLIFSIIASPLCVVLFSKTIVDQAAKLATGNLALRFQNTVYVLKTYWFYFLGIGSTQYDKLYRIDSRIGSWDVFSNMYLRFGVFFVGLLIYRLCKVRKDSWKLLGVTALSLLTESLLGPVVFVMIEHANNNHRHGTSRHRFTRL